MDSLAVFDNEPDVRTFFPGEVIFQEGDPSHEVMFMLLDGIVEIVFSHRVLDVLTAGHVFGEMALIDGLPRAATAIARTECRAAAVNEHRFKAIVLQNPSFALDMMKILTERVRRNLSGY
jgi:CRP-like cAMP-binding protein